MRSGTKLISKRVKQKLVLNCRESEVWGPVTVSLAGKGKAVEIRISGEIQELKGVGHGRCQDWWLLPSFRLKYSMGLDGILWVCLNPLEPSLFTWYHAFLQCVCLTILYSLTFDAFNLMLLVYPRCKTRLCGYR